ncbi:MAG: riboflavin synthase [Tepidisphaeraceae bacterium]|jgi:riboflavin synthase
MFSGIVERIATVAEVTDGPGLRRLTLATDFHNLQPGQSIAVNGCCLTIAQISPQGAGFDVIKESLDRTNLGLLKAGDGVNIERSLKAGDRIDGHFVQGHVDGRAMLIDIVAGPEETRLTLQAPAELAKYIVPKGSVAVDGVSLTVAAVRGSVFEVALIPTTLRLTTLGRKSKGWPFNLETDILSKTVVSWLESREMK